MEHDSLGDSLGWKWFEYHAKQRLDVFKFYMTIYAAITVAGGYLLDKHYDHLGSIFGLLAVVISIVFWQLDVRSRHLTEIGEKLIKASSESAGIPPELNPVLLVLSHFATIADGRESAMVSIHLLGG